MGVSWRSCKAANQAALSRVKLRSLSIQVLHRFISASRPERAGLSLGLAGRHGPITEELPHEINCLPHRLNLHGNAIRDVDGKLFFKLHHKFDGIQGICPKNPL